MPEIVRSSVTRPSRSASAPGEEDHSGGTIGSASVPGPPRAALPDPPMPSTPAPGPCSPSTALASRSTVSVTHGGTRSPVARRAEVASTSVWLTLSTAISCMSRRDRPLAEARPVSIASYASLSAAASA